MIKVAIVIPVHNRRETTLQALKSLSRIDASGIDLRIFVVDDGSTDGTSKAIRSHFPTVQLLKGSGNLHYAAGTNRGIEASLKWDPEFIVIMNDDSIFHEQFLQRLLTTANANPRSLVGSLLLLWDDPHKVFQVDPVWDTFRGGWIFPDDLTAFTAPVEPFEVECLVGNCLLIPTQAIKECGVLDEFNFPHGWGDAQFTTRLKKAGWRLLVDPRSLVWCEPNTNPPPLHTLNLSDKLRILFRNEKHPVNLKRQLTARWYSAPSRTKAVAAFIVYLLDLAAKSARYMGDR